MSDECRDVLVERNLGILKQESQARFFLMSLIDKEFYEGRSDQVWASYGPFDGGWDHFQEAYSREKELHQVAFTKDEALSILTLTSLPGAVEAWRDCMTANRRGLFGWLEGDLSSTLFTLWLEWAPPTGLDGKKLTKLTTSIESENGKAAYTQKLPDELLPGRSPFNLKREAPGVSVRGTIRAKVGTGAYGISFFVPPYKPVFVGPYYLAEHPEALLQQQNIHAGLRFGHVYWQPTVLIAGVDYTGKALGMHAPDGVGFADFAIPPGARYFASVVGMARQDSTGAYGEATCRVYIDGLHQWQIYLSGAAVAQTPVIGIPDGAKVLRLEVDGGSSAWGDHTTWGNPRFMRQPNE